MATEYINTGTCGDCYQFITDACPEDVLELPTGLADGTEIHWEITDKFGHKYRGSGNVNSDENIEIDVSGFPEGSFTQHSGIFTFEILSIDEAPPIVNCAPVPLTICEEDYSCIAFSFTGITVIEEETEGDPYGYTGEDTA